MSWPRASMWLSRRQKCSHSKPTFSVQDEFVYPNANAKVGTPDSASRAAARLYTHRNTLLRRLARADELLPRPLAESSVSVAVALGVLRWRGNHVH
ncbi:MAG: hypothetical protein QOJ20_2428 [Mycobacterium sp.]|nr:hypothetical protein [Mycobacterium sp.]MDT5281233.1 hypothetical protein [Mycobacterium sp.]